MVHDFKCYLARVVAGSDVPKKKVLKIQLPREDREQLQREADREHLDLGTWVRRALLKAAKHAKPSDETRDKE